MRFLTVLMLLVSAPSLFGEARIARANATTPTEAVNWTAGVPLSYDGAGNIVQIGEDRFTYDRVGRLVEAKINGVNRTYQYDAFGNRTGCAHDPQSDCQFGVEIEPRTNRTKGAKHDGRGNVETFAGHTYTYDEVNMAKRDDGGSGSREFIYTAEDERIAIASGSELQWTLRDLGGKVLREFTSDYAGSAFQWKKDYVYRSGQLLASRHVVNTIPITYYYHLDHLGSPRRVTDHSNRIVGFHDYFAFGPEVPGGLSEPMATSLKYTGHERDRSGSGDSLAALDYMHARYYAPAAGRLLSVDPIVTKAAMRAPQLWNRYAYVGNNPLKFSDPDGRLLKLANCAQENQGSPACNVQLNLFLSTFGKRSGEVARYLQLGKDGTVSFKGISGAAFATKFGLMGRATNYLVSNRAATFTLVTGSSQRTAQAGGAFFDPTRVSTTFSGDAYPGGGTIGIDPKAFPITRGTVSISATEALAHEIGHAVGSLIQGIRDDFDSRLAKSLWTGNEGYSMAFENRWRVEVLGLPPNDMRAFYQTARDVSHDSTTPLFP